MATGREYTSSGWTRKNSSFVGFRTEIAVRTFLAPGKPSRPVGRRRAATLSGLRPAPGENAPSVGPAGLGEASGSKASPTLSAWPLLLGGAVPVTLKWS